MSSDGSVESEAQSGSASQCQHSTRWPQSADFPIQNSQSPPQQYGGALSNTSDAQQLRVTHFRQLPMYTGSPQSQLQSRYQSYPPVPPSQNPYTQTLNQSPGTNSIPVSVLPSRIPYSQDWDQSPRIPDARMTQVRPQWNTGVNTGISTSLHEEEKSRLSSTFRRPHRPRKFFKVGKVFLVLWSEPAGGSLTTRSDPGISTTLYGEEVFSKIRRFVVIREGHTYCVAAAISTYDGRGVAKSGIIKQDHAIIHSGRSPPAPHSQKGPMRYEIGMMPRAIRVDMDSPEEKLHPMSRINFGKLYTIEHNMKVRSLGMVNKGSLAYLADSFVKTLQNSLAQTADLNSTLRETKLRSIIPQDSKLGHEETTPRALPAASSSNGHVDVQACATKVALFFRDKGLVREADELEQRVSSFFPIQTNQSSESDSDAETDEADTEDEIER